MSYNIIERYFPTITDEQKNKFQQLGSLYNEWNEKINVISRKDIDNFYERHVLHSLAIAKIITFEKGTTLLDVGTGGGFPGIPLAILFPECTFHLIDSINKKITVVKGIADALQLKNVTAEQTRVEKHKNTYDFVLSRAVTQFDMFHKLTRKNIHNQNKNSIQNGTLYLKGGDFDDELSNINDPIKLYSITDFFEESFFETKKVIHVAKKFN